MEKCKQIKIRIKGKVSKDWTEECHWIFLDGKKMHSSCCRIMGDTKSFSLYVMVFIFSPISTH